MKHVVRLAKALAAAATLSTALVAPNAHGAGDIQAGKDLFSARCASCHHVGPSARAAFGPQLNGIFGRKAGGTEDYRYSDAMKTSAVVWDEASLRAFVQSLAKVVPGTKMRFWGISNTKQIDDLLAYLRTFQ